jgi:methionine synthase II (cobalamin-independent)
MASAYMYVSPAARTAYVSVYERALRQALQDILAAIPAPHLALQWDVCQEVLVYEGFFADRPADYKAQIVAELARLGEAVPDAVEMGYHLCYGSPADEHLVMPRDMGIMVEIATAVRGVVARRIDFLHLPVPKHRTDAAYFRPLTQLEGFDQSTLYLGLIHHDDRDGDRARMNAARALVGTFGVASECGWGRTDPQRVPGLLESHRVAAEHLHGSS